MAEAKKKVTKPDTVKIVHFQSQVFPNVMGTGVSVTVFGLGDDNVLYQWDNNQKAWVVD